jgi:hypothetical protein
MNGAKRSAEAVGCKNTSVGERSALEEPLARAVVDEAEARMSA